MDPMTGMMAANALGGAVKSGGPSSSSSSSSFDASGWNINFGSGGITSERVQTDPAGNPVGGMNAYLPYVLAGVGLLIVWRMTRKS